jgi:hypothetical protein
VKWAGAPGLAAFRDLGAGITTSLKVYLNLEIKVATV